MIVKTESWESVTRRFRGVAESNASFRPMLELVEKIGASKYASGLYPWTSMHTLCISQTQEADSDKEVLRISRDPHTGNLIFDFQETGSTLPKYQHWIRRCPPEEGFSRFERFVKLKAWFVDYTQGLNE